jgi:hypothetical protein
MSAKVSPEHYLFTRRNQGGALQFIRYIHQKTAGVADINLLPIPMHFAA